MPLQYERGNRRRDTGSRDNNQKYDIVAKRREMEAKLTGSEEIDELVSRINVNDPQTIVSFGSEAANEISKCSDAILNNIDSDRINDSGALLAALGKIMDKFDLEELSNDEKKKGLVSRVFGGAQDKVGKVLSKYHSMGEEVDKIYVQLRKYEDEIAVSNEKLETIFKANVGYYQELVKYILAGEQGLREIDVLITELERERAENPEDASIGFEHSSMLQARSILEQRVQDLRIAENVAIQSIPMLQSMQYSNFNLVRKINSAFIITLPVFKQALSQALLLKRQKIQAKAMQALDERTNEMLLKNAKNTADQAKLTAMLASSGSIRIETLEQTWQTIVNGIEETRRIQNEASIKREEDARKLEQMKQQFKELGQ